MGDTPAARSDDIDLDALLHDWSLNANDLLEIDRMRSPESRLWTALHLCSLRQTGRFAEDPERIPHEAISHLAHQIGIEPPARLPPLHRQATDSAVRARVRDHLGFAAFSPDAEVRLTSRLADLATDGLGTADLVERAEALLLADRIILPSRTALERLVLSVNRQALQTLFTRIASSLPGSLRVALDRLVGNPGEDTHGDEGRAAIGRYRTPPASSMGRFTRTARERVEEIDALLTELPDLSEIPHRVQRQLAQLCRRYDGHALRRFPADKRHSLLVCFLIDRRQSLLDDLVQAHDNQMTGLMRRRCRSQTVATSGCRWACHADRHRGCRAGGRPRGVRGRLTASVPS